MAMAMVKAFDINARGTDYTVGDIHGCYDQLMDAMRRVDFDRSRGRLFSVGDLIDRGPRSLDCLNLPYEKWFHTVRGNHEELAQKALLEKTPRSFDLWMVNGGSWVYNERTQKVRETLDDVLKLVPYAMEIQVTGCRVGIVHAQPPADWSQVYSANADMLHSMVWSRSRISRENKTPVAGIDAVVVGHTILDTPVSLGNVLFIDTGAFNAKNGGHLTLLSLDEVLLTNPQVSNML